MCSATWAWQFCYHSNILGSRPPQYNGFSGHLWHSILIFADGASYAWSSKHMNMLGRVHGLFKYFSSWKSLKYWNQVGGDWKRVSCHGNKIFCCCRCVICRTISLPSFRGLCWKLTKTALFIYLMYYWFEHMIIMMSSAISFAYFTHFSNLNISGTSADVCKR